MNLGYGEVVDAAQFNPNQLGAKYYWQVKENFMSTYLVFSYLTMEIILFLFLPF